MKISELAILDVIKSHKREDQFELSKVKAPKYLGSDNKYHYILYSYNNDLLLASSNLMVGFAYRRYLEDIYNAEMRRTDYRMQLMFDFIKDENIQEKIEIYKIMS